MYLKPWKAVQRPSETFENAYLCIIRALWISKKKKNTKIKTCNLDRMQLIQQPSARLYLWVPMLIVIQKKLHQSSYEEDVAKVIITDKWPFQNPKLPLDKIYVPRNQDRIAQRMTFEKFANKVTVPSVISNLFSILLYQKNFRNEICLQLFAKGFPYRCASTF